MTGVCAVSRIDGGGCGSRKSPSTTDVELLRESQRTYVCDVIILTTSGDTVRLVCPPLEHDMKHSLQNIKTSWRNLVELQRHILHSGTVLTTEDGLSTGGRFREKILTYQAEKSHKPDWPAVPDSESRPRNGDLNFMDVEGVDALVLKL